MITKQQRQENNEIMVIPVFSTFFYMTGSKKKLQVKMDLDQMKTKQQQYPNNAKPEDLKAYKVYALYCLFSCLLTTY